MSDPLVNAMTQAIEGQNLYHGRYGTTPAGSATARAILAHLRDLGWTLPATPAPMDGPCIFVGCVSRDRHTHGGFPGGYTNPDDPTGAPIPFTTEAAPGVRDYNGALLATPAPLDVKRLARVMREMCDCIRSDDDAAVWARDIAEEYAAYAEESLT